MDSQQHIKNTIFHSQLGIYRFETQRYRGITVYLLKKYTVSGPMQFEPMLFKIWNPCGSILSSICLTVFDLVLGVPGNFILFFKCKTFAYNTLQLCILSFVQSAGSLFLLLRRGLADHINPIRDQINSWLDYSALERPSLLGLSLSDILRICVHHRSSPQHLLTPSSSLISYGRSITILLRIFSVFYKTCV